MTRSKRKWTPGGLASLVAALGLAGGAGCGQPAGTGAAKAPARAFKVVVLRSDDPGGVEEPSLDDVRDGLKQAGLRDGKTFALTGAKVGADPKQAEAALAKAGEVGPDLIVALGADAAKAAVGRAGKVPVVFEIWGPPSALGLGKEDRDHPPELTGVYTPFEGSLTLGIARSSLPKAKRLGILYNPDDPLSAADKDAILRDDPKNPVPVEFGEFRDQSGVLPAARALLEKPVDAILLARGVGPGSAEVIAEASKAKVPVFGFTREHVRRGAALARVPDPRWGWFEAGRRAGRILNGESPAQIPLHSGGSGYITVVNTDVTKELGVKPPGGVLRDAEVYPKK